MKIICIGRNYTKHIAELENEKPTSPIFFLKPDTSILPPGQDFYIPHFSNNIHYEVEVLIKISQVGKYIQNNFAHKYYKEIGLGIDFTARDMQLELKNKGLPWEKSKAFDGSAVIGKWIYKEKLKNINQINFYLKKNNDIVQKSNTNLMLWKIDEIIAYASQFFTLKIGDIIFTGTPSGVGQVVSGDILKGFLENKEYFSINVI